MWRTTGFLMNFAVVAEFATLAGFLVVLLGGRIKRREGSGWKALGGLLAAVAAAQFVGMAVVVSHRFFLFNFSPDEHLSASGVWKEQR